jgi:RNA polymerase sigma factor (sigma-70 family)
VVTSDLSTTITNYLTASTESDFISNENIKQREVVLSKAINNLPARQREVMYMRYYQGLSFDQIAGLMLLSRKSAYNIVFKALDALRKNRMLVNC